LALEAELERADARLRKSEGEVEELERLKAEAAGSALVARRAIDELEQRLTEQRESLAELTRLEEARRILDELAAERDSVTLRVAATIDSVLVQLDELERARTTAPLRAMPLSAAPPVALNRSSFPPSLMRGLRP
jgi:hypothetical protein